MKPENRIFFSEHGITSTSANYLANLAKEELAQDQAELDSADFLTVSANVIGSGAAPMIFSEGKDEEYISSLEKRFNKGATMNSFCAWMRESIKAKEDEELYWKNYALHEWAKDVEGVEVPQVACKPTPTIEDVIGDMNVKEREEYYHLEAEAAFIGKYIHERGSINEARKKLHKGLAKPAWKDGTGRDTLIYNNTASVKPELVDEIFEKLQNKHRSVEQRLNSIKAKQKEELNKRIAKHRIDLIAETQKVQAETAILTEKYRKFIQDKLEEVNKLKIVIPEHLKDTYEYLNAKGKVE